MGVGRARTVLARLVDSRLGLALSSRDSRALARRANRRALGAISVWQLMVKGGAVGGMSGFGMPNFYEKAQLAGV
jgi:hypothetical protein